MAQLQAGDKAPLFSLPDQDDNTVRLSNYQGMKVLVYFYPKAMTSGCTEQSCSVNEALPKFSDLDVSVLGISPDSPESQKEFAEKYDLEFPLLADEDHTVAADYGVWAEKSMYGKKSMGIIRSSFLIDEKGKIIEAWYNVSPKDTVPKALAALEE